MSLYRAITNNVTKVLNVIGNTAESVEKTLDIANIYVEENHKKFQRTIKQDAIYSTASHHAEIASELEKDAKLKAIFDELENEW